MPASQLTSVWPLILLWIGAGAPDAPNRNREALTKLQAYVGAWRGVGQVRRGSNQGAWIEKSDWVWDFAGSKAHLRFTSSKAKYIRAGSLHWAGEPYVCCTGCRDLFHEDPEGVLAEYRARQADEGQLGK